MPANHFGPIPGIEVGMAWRFRIQLSESGVHRPPVSGIHGRDVDGAYSIVLSGNYIFIIFVYQYFFITLHR